TLPVPACVDQHHDRNRAFFHAARRSGPLGPQAGRQGGRLAWASGGRKHEHAYGRSLRRGTRGRHPGMNMHDGCDMKAALAKAEASAQPRPLTQAFWARLQAHPYEQDIFQALRWIDARGGSNKRLGRAGRPRHERVRVRQMPHMVFAPSTLASAEPPRDGRPARLSIYSFGLFGPNGPLPLHMTEYARERLIHHGDGALTAFADIFHNRLILLFYRA